MAFTICCFAAISGLLANTCIAGNGVTVDGQEPRLALETSEQVPVFAPWVEADEKAKNPRKMAYAAVEKEKSKTLAEKLENLGRLYENDDNPYMQEL